MGKDYQHTYKRLVQLMNWNALSELFDEVISAAGLDDETAIQKQRDIGKRIAEQRNQHLGKKI